MKKVKYYAPYWVSAIIVAVIIIGIAALLHGRITPFSELPQLAAELESNDYFIREDGIIMESTDSRDAYTGTALTPCDQYWVKKPKAKAIHEMLPHEYAALISDEDIYVRKDGKVFVRHIKYPGLKKEYVLPICPPSQLPEDASEAEIEVMEEHDWYSEHFLASIAVRTPVENNSATLNWCLSVKLSNGWYIISEGSHHSIIVDDSTPYFHILSSFPALHEGDYRLEFNMGGSWSYKALTLTRKDTDNYTLTY